MEKLTFLVVDDDQGTSRSVATTIHDILMEKNLSIECEVLFVIGPYQAIQKFRTNVIDFVITDLHMGGLNGEQLLSVVANLSPHTVLAMMTGDEHYCLPNVLSSIDLLDKPISDDDLVKILDKVIELLMVATTQE